MGFPTHRQRRTYTNTIIIVGRFLETTIPQTDTSTHTHSHITISLNHHLFLISHKGEITRTHTHTHAQYTHTNKESLSGVGYRHGLFLDFLCYHYHGTISLLSFPLVSPISYHRLLILLSDGTFVVKYLVGLLSISLSSRVGT